MLTYNSLVYTHLRTVVLAIIKQRPLLVVFAFKWAETSVLFDDERDTVLYTD